MSCLVSSDSLYTEMNGGELNRHIKYPIQPNVILDHHPFASSFGFLVVGVRIPLMKELEER